MVSAVGEHVTAATPATSGRPWLAAGTQFWREWLRFLRQPGRVVGAIAQPGVFWLVFGAGLGPSFRMPGIEGAGLDYRSYFFPGTVVLILLFTAIFTTISLIEDRREGFLQAVLVAPVPRWSMVLGKVLGGASMALAEALLFLVLGLFIGVRFSAVGLAAIVVFLSAAAVALVALGFVLAWRSESTQGYHAVMSVLLFPMWLLSGAFFPATSGPLYWLMVVNPMTYMVAGLRRLLYFDRPELLPPAIPSLGTCWAVTLVFGAAMMALAWLGTNKRISGDLL